MKKLPADLTIKADVPLMGLMSTLDTVRKDFSRQERGTAYTYCYPYDPGGFPRELLPVFRVLDPRLPLLLGVPYSSIPSSSSSTISGPSGASTASSQPWHGLDSSGRLPFLGSMRLKYFLNQHAPIFSGFSSLYFFFCTHL